MCAHGMSNSNKILHGDQTILEDSFTWLTTPMPWPKIFVNVTRMLMRDLLVAANLFVKVQLALIKAKHVRRV